MEGNKKISSIFDKCHVSASQEIFLRTCGFAQRGVPPDSDPSVVGVSPPPRRASDDSETDSVIDSGYEDDLVESHAIRFVSPPESVEVEKDAMDRTESNVGDEGGLIALEKSANMSSSSNSKKNGSHESLETPAKKLKIPLREVVKAIVMNSRSKDEKDREIGKTMSCLQILMEKGFKFP